MTRHHRLILLLNDHMIISIYDHFLIFVYIDLPSLDLLSISLYINGFLIAWWYPVIVLELSTNVLDF